ncbi:hypothetical protein JCM19275_2190 [Nonlabens ulvanivorans]|uniref:Uncharacterized protein n=1 Tax=Nonlabens ulvanivorans TaxID=906888 RepID=A0A090WIP2_NONUL|nr:hypothetical protein JCM19275_2190 [Nonlabens ulvanivorans]
MSLTSRSAFVIRFRESRKKITIPIENRIIKIINPIAI